LVNQNSQQKQACQPKNNVSNTFGHHASLPRVHEWEFNFRMGEFSEYSPVGKKTKNDLVLKSHF
jgi:hypothetical protein